MGPGRNPRQARHQRYRKSRRENQCQSGIRRAGGRRWSGRFGGGYLCCAQRYPYRCCGGAFWRPGAGHHVDRELYLGAGKPKGRSWPARLKPMCVSTDVGHHEPAACQQPGARRRMPVTARNSLESGATLKSKTVILATGARWREMGVPGEQEYKAKGVCFCPHCDGPAVQGQARGGDRRR